MKVTLKSPNDRIKVATFDQKSRFWLKFAAGWPFGSEYRDLQSGQSMRSDQHREGKSTEVV
jgi:hypothetical protein